MNLNFAGGKHDWPNLAYATPDQLTVLRPLSETEADAYYKATDAITSFVHAHWPIRVVEDNIVALQDFIQDTEIRFKNNQVRDYTDDLHVGMNRHIMNFLSSAGAFMAFTQRRHKRLFPRASTEVQNLLNFIAQSRSDSFALRFVLQLRNHAAHFSLPLGGLNFHANTGEKGEKLRKVKVTFRTDALLEDKEWDAGLQSELLAGGPEIEVLPMLIGAMEQLGNIQKLATSHMLPAAVPHAEFILQLNGEVKQGVAHIARSIQTKSDPPRQWQISYSPLFPDRAEEVLKQLG